VNTVPGLAYKHYIRLKISAKDKHSSLLQTLTNNGSKKFYDYGPWEDIFETCCKLLDWF
jgi:hypothetical protein